MNEDRFTGKADIYKKFRPTYPKELMDYLYSEVGFSKDSIIADIGAGTGIFSRLLLERGSHVYCVEPNGDMRQTAIEDLSEYKNFVSVNAPAENTGLPEHNVDFVTAAQAFHWFDRQAFKAECQRVLKDSGKVVLVWNIRDSKCDIIKKEYVIREKYSIDSKGLGGSGGPPEDYLEFFADRVCEVRTFRNDLEFDRESFIGRNVSASYIPRESEDPEKYRGFVKELNELFDEYNVNGILNFPHFTESYVGRV
ncbi:MAG: class I SAM-dependent methyltransferase [Oscillospiraceae bacterium]|nr:class I SAM-dependent methyltransferase [Oscillospiraceae bacterium]